MPIELKNEEGLDPADWNDMKALGHLIIDDMVDYLKNVAQRPIYQPVPEKVKAEFKKPVPAHASDIFSIYREFKQNIFPYHGGNVHPKHFAWVHGTGTPLGAFADLLAATMNSNLVIGDHSAMYVEGQVINWLKEIMNFPADASGLLVSGCTIANITAMIVARNSLPANVKDGGVYNVAGKLTAYCSTETHYCMSKAAEVIGIGNEQLRKIPVNERYEIDLNALKAKILEDKAAGFVPFCIIGNAGTVNTGAIDPLSELSQIAREEKIWFHTDGAFGAMAKLAPAYQDKLKAIEEADSLAFDLHKWMYVNYDVGCVLFKDAATHKKSFARAVDYLSTHERGMASGNDLISNYGMELSRGFKALKVWMSLKEHGVEKYRRMVMQNIQQAFYLGQQIAKMPELELLADVTMNVVCYRYNPGDRNDDELNKLNKELLMRMHEQAVAGPSSTVLDGKYAIRAAITNHRTRKHDLDEMLEGTVKIGRELVEESKLVV